MIDIEITVNGRVERGAVESRKSLADYLREDLNLTGTHVSCEQGVCGACTVLVDDDQVRACLFFAVQAAGARVTTVEGIADDEALHPVQQAFAERLSFQCGFCTPGFVITTVALLREKEHPSEDEIVDALSGNLCRCTGYQAIVEAVIDLVKR